MYSGISSLFVEDIINYVSSAIGIDAGALLSLVSPTPSAGYGDFSIPCYSLAKIIRLSPQRIASELAAVLKSYLGRISFLRDISAEGAYLNFHLDRHRCTSDILSLVANRGDAWMASDLGCGKTVCIDFCSPNVAKPLHLGHLRSTVIGNSLARLYANLGYRVIRINYVGDWGTAMGKLMAGWELWGAGKNMNCPDELLRVYVAANRAAGSDMSIVERAKEITVALESGDEGTLKDWTNLRDGCLCALHKTLARLGVEFDVWDAESFRQQSIPQVMHLLRAQEIMQESSGAQVVFLDGLPPCIVARSDSATLYATRDLATALHRQDVYAPWRSLYVVDKGQSLHFQQVFAVLRRAGCDWVSGLKHISFGVLRTGGQRLRSREGDIVRLDDVIDASIAIALERLEQKSPDMEAMEESARDIGIGALVFADLIHTRDSDVDYDAAVAVSLDGETGPYVQYAHARCMSILAKAGYSQPLMALDSFHTERPTAEPDDTEWGLVTALLGLHAAARGAITDDEPHLMARAVLDCAKALNRFYRECPVLRADSDTKAFRLALVGAVAVSIEKALWLLGIQAPRMRGE